MRSMKFDIKVAGNIISGRQGWAYICNSMKFAVLKADLNAEQKYDDFKTFSKVRIAKPYKNHELLADGVLEVEKGRWTIGGHGCCISSSFGYSDMTKLIEAANTPVIRKDDVIAVATFANDIEFACINLFKVKNVDIHCTVMADLEPLTEEEMQGIVKDAEDWCNR